MVPLQVAGLSFRSATHVVVGRLAITAAQADCAKQPPNEGHIHPAHLMPGHHAHLPSLTCRCALLVVCVM